VLINIKREEYSMNVYSTTDNDKKRFPTDVVGSKFPLALGVQCVEMTLQPSGSIPTHPKDSDALFYVVEGEVVVVIGDEEKSVTGGTLVESPKELVHGIQNRSNKIAKVLVIKM
jgi:mannose-6-phosphate isomerase-like protein (cupin superfamily)